MVHPSGDQFEIRGGGYQATVTEAGATLRWLEYAGRSLIDGFSVQEKSFGGRGQLLMPWPNRIEDGRFEFEGVSHQLPLSEVKRGHASHGLARWAAWTVEEQTENSVSLMYRLMAQPGYQWTVDLHVLYDLSADGLTVTQTATNMSDSPAPYACGAHPYLRLGRDVIDGYELRLPAATRLLTDERLIPTTSEPVAGTDWDFRLSRPIRHTSFDHAFTDMIFESVGHGPSRATVELRDPASGRGVALWVDQQHRWLQVYSGDDQPDTARRSLAVEPMTAPANAFNTGTDLTVLAPAGETGNELSVSWGIRALDETAG